MTPVKKSPSLTVAVTADDVLARTHPRIAASTLTDIVLAMGLVEPERMTAAIAEARRAGTEPDDVLFKSGALTPEGLARAVAERQRLPYLDVSQFAPDMEAAKLIPLAVAERYQALPIAVLGDGSLLVAMANPTNGLALDDIAVLTGRATSAAVMSVEALRELISGLRDGPSTASEASVSSGALNVVLDNTAVLALSEVSREVQAHRHGAAVADLVNLLLTTLAEHKTVAVQLATHAIDERDRSSTRSPLESLVQHMTAQSAVPSESAARQAQRNAVARAELLEEFGALTGEEIGEQHSRARNRHALAARWRKELRAFGVTHQGRTLYPGFQFDPTSGELRPAIRDVLATLPADRMSDWEVALWWTASNGWLDGRRPVDLLADDPGRIVSAAARLAEPGPL